MSSHAFVEQDARSEHVVDVPRRLLVTVRVAPEGDRAGHRLYRHVGFLECTQSGYQFTYTEAARRDARLRLLGFGDPERVYRSQEMFPLFAERIMSARRPDRAHYLSALDLDEQSEPWEILVRSGGRRAGDTIEVIPEPQVAADGATTCLFLVHGVRYRGSSASAAICSLRSGDNLKLRWDSENPVNPLAVLVLAESGTELGYVPDPLVGFVQEVMAHPETDLRVVRANGPEVGEHLRLLVRLSGSVDSGYSPFGDDETQGLIGGVRPIG